MAEAPPPILIADDRHGLPFSKGLLAQSFMSAGLPPSRSYAMSKSVEDRLREDGELRITIPKIAERRGGTISVPITS